MEIFPNITSCCCSYSSILYPSRPSLKNESDDRESTCHFHSCGTVLSYLGDLTFSRSHLLVGGEWSSQLALGILQYRTILDSLFDIAASECGRSQQYFTLQLWLPTAFTRENGT